MRQISIPPAETSQSANLSQLALATALADGENVASVAKAMNMSDRVVKAAQAPMLTTDSDLAGFADTRSILTSFVPMLRNTSAFFRLLDGGLMLKIPLRQRLTWLTGAASMAVVNQSEVIHVSRMVSDHVSIDPVRATGICIFSDEFLKFLSEGGSGFLSLELRRAIAAAVDVGFFDLIVDGDTPSHASFGGDCIGAAVDCRYLFNAVELTAESRPLFVCAPDVARKAATLIDAGIGLLFPRMGPMGGEMFNVEAIVSDALDPGTLVLIDGAAIAGDVLGITIKSAKHAVVQLDSSPDSPATDSTTLVSLWQRNLTGLKPEVYFGAKRLRDNALAKITGIAWGATDSPAA